MKKLLLAVILFFCITNMSPSYTENKSSFQLIPCEKTYVTPEHISIFDDGIFVLCQGDWIRNGGVFCDAQGHYFNTTQVLEEATHICPRCNTENSHYRKICIKCGAPLI